MDRQQLSAMQSERFPDLPLDCNRSEPGVVDTDEWRDWSEFGTTGAQLRIEDHLDRLGMRGKSILQIGIGNSGLAKRFARQATTIVGITIEPAEVKKAASFGLSNYRVLLLNKYSGENDPLGGRPFDFIVDDGPTTFCCCMTHLGVMLDFYASKLTEDGQIVMEREGLGAALNVPWAHPRWGFSFEDIAAVAPLAGLTAYRVTNDIYVLARAAPARPTLLSQGNYYVRKFSRKLWRIVTLRGKLLGK